MKAKKTILVVAVVFAVVCLLSVDARAAWYTCSIDNVGSTSSKIAVRLTDTDSTPDFTKNWFFLAGTKDKEMLATVLTALSLGKNVLVNAQGTTAFSDITGIYVIP